MGLPIGLKPGFWVIYILKLLGVRKVSKRNVDAHLSLPYVAFFSVWRHHTTRAAIGSAVPTLFYFGAGPHNTMVEAHCLTPQLTDFHKNINGCSTQWAVYLSLIHI